MTTQTLSQSRSQVWLSLIKTNRTKYAGVALVGLGLIIITLFLSAPWQVFSALLASTLLLYLAVRPLAAYFIYDWGGNKEYDVLAEMGQVNQANCLVEISCGLNRGTLGMHPHFQGKLYYLFNIYDAKHTPSPQLTQTLEFEADLPKLKQIYPRSAAPGRLPLPDGFAEVVYADFTLHELKNPADREAIFAEIRRLLHPTKGRLLVAEHNRNWFNFLLLGSRSLSFIPETAWKEHLNTAKLNIEIHRRWRGVVDLWCISR